MMEHIRSSMTHFSQSSFLDGLTALVSQWTEWQNTFGYTACDCFLQPSFLLDSGKRSHREERLTSFLGTDPYALLIGDMEDCSTHERWNECFHKIPWKFAAFSLNPNGYLGFAPFGGWSSRLLDYDLRA